MNIICNDCVGAMLYRQSGLPFNNPFMWNHINSSYFNLLIKNWDNINFKNIRLWMDENGLVFLKIDEKIELDFPHYKQDESYKDPIREGIDLFYYDILPYAKNIYLRRLDRMLKLTCQPTFVFDTKLSISENAIKTIANIDIENNIIITIDKSRKHLLELERPNRIFIFKNDGDVTSIVADKILDSPKFKDLKIL